MRDPEPAIAALDGLAALATRRSRDFVRTLPGFRGDLIVATERPDGVEIATVAAWDSRAAIAAAKDLVAAS